MVDDARAIVRNSMVDDARAIVRFGWPVALASVAPHAMSFVDLAVVGHLLGAQSLAVCACPALPTAARC